MRDVIPGNRAAWPVSVALLIVGCALAHERGAPERDAAFGMDAAVVGSEDAMPPIDAGSDAPTVDARRPDAGPPDPRAPRSIAPMTTSTVTSSQPTLRWALGEGSDGVHVELCRDRAMTDRCTSFDGLGTQGRPDSPLAPGAWFWRLGARIGDVTLEPRSPVWQLFVRARSSSIDTSYGTVLDVNGDGYADVAISLFSGSWDVGGVELYEGGPSGLGGGVTTGTFLSDREPRGIASAGDLNGDGYGDLLVTLDGDGYHRGGHLVIHLGGPGGISSGTPIDAMLADTDATSVFFAESPVGLGDIDGDGYGDIAFESASGVQVYRGSPAGIVSDASPSAILPRGPYGGRVGAAGDVDGDGYADLAFVSSESSGSLVSIYAGGPDGIVTGAAPTTLLRGAYDSQASIDGACDLNGDGYSDLIVGSGHGLSRLFVYFGGPGGIASDASPTLLAAPSAGDGHCAGDVDGDGFDDLVTFTVGTAAARTASIFRGDASGVAIDFSSVLLDPDGQLQFPQSMTGGGDIDGDGIADIVGGAPYERAYVYLGVRGGLAPRAMPDIRLRIPVAGASFGWHVE